MSAETSTPARKILRHPSIFIDSVTQLVPPGDEKPLKQALYTTASIALFLVVGGVAISTYFVLQVFIKPLLWAVLCGSFLFPFKYTLHKLLKNWLKDILNRDQSLILSCILLPFSMFNKASDWIGSVVMKKWKILLAVMLGLMPLYGLYQLELINLFMSFASAVLIQSYNLFSWTFQFFENHSIFVLIWILILLATAIFTTHTPILQLVSIPLWTLITLYMLINCGVFKIPVVLIVVGLIMLGINSTKPDTTATSSTASLESESGVTDIHQQSSERQTVVGSDSTNPSDAYFNILFLLFLIVLVWMHTWVIFLMLVPLAFWVSKMLISHHKTSQFVDMCCRSGFNQPVAVIIEKVKQTWQRNRAVLLPYPLPEVGNLMRKGDRKVQLVVLSCLPTITSVLIILILFACAFFMTTLVAVKIHQESILAVQLTSNVLNETVSEHPEYKAWLPDNETMQKTMSSIADKVYIQGREWISQRLHHLPTERLNRSNSSEIQLLRMWDQIYQTWFPKAHTPLRRLTRQSSFKATNDNSMFYGLIDVLSGSEVRSWIEDNLSSLMSIGESVLTILQSNIGLIISFVTSFSAAILSGGTIVLNFVVAILIFFTTLFYLLASSTDQYKPIEVIGLTIKPLILGTPFETTIQDAVSGVFGASIKMFGFYGLYTWVNHSMFGSNLVYIPSVLAAIFGVIPLLTTYWVCLPSALEIWLLQGSVERAVCLIVFQFLPTFFVDAAIYRDISKVGGGGHPYVTGLAVAGGLYSFGLEGAITGPLILCFLLIAINLFTIATSNPASQTVKKLQI